MMAAMIAFLKITFLSLSLVHVAVPQTCEKLDASLFPSCVRIGHTQTFALPSFVDKKKISTLLHIRQNLTSKCAVPQSAANAFYCALFLPLCVEKRKDPLWPCRRVCAQFVLSCKNTLDRDAMDYFGAMCNVLPDSPPESKECFEPANFTSNLTDLSFMGQCHKRLIPMCGQFGYNYTRMSRESQRILLKVGFNKDLDSDTLNQSDYLLPPWQEKSLSKYTPECVALARKIYCAQGLPPCFPEEDSSQFYGMCQSDCEKIRRLCPGFFSSHPLEGEICAEFPNEKPVMNFCEHSQWSRKLPYFFTKKDKGKKQQNNSGIKPGVIAVAVVVPLVVIVTVIVGVWIYWRGYHVTVTAYRKHSKDDTTNIVA